MKLKDYLRRLSEQENEREKLILKCAEYCNDYNMSVREIAENVGIGKTRVHEYLRNDLKNIDFNLWLECRDRLKRHKIQKRDVQGRFCR